MIQKSFIFKPMNFTIIIVLGLIFAITPIISANTCSQSDMTKYPLNDATFQQYGGWYPDVTPIENYYFFLKVFYDDIFNPWRISFGNIKDRIDFKRDFHLALRNTPLHWDFWLGENYGIAVVLGRHTAYNYRANYGRYFLVHRLDKSIAIIFRFYDHSIRVYNCLKKECNLDKNPDYLQYYDGLSQSKNLDLHIIYSASDNSIKVYKNSPQDIRWNLLISFYDANLKYYLRENNGYGYVGLTATEYYGNYFNDLYGSYYCIDGVTKITPTVNLYYKEESINPGQTITVPPYQQLLLKVVYKNKDEADLMGPGKITIDGIEVKKPITQSNNIYSFTYSTESVFKQYEFVYHTDYDKFRFLINVQSVEVSKLYYEYGKDPADRSSYIIDDGVRILKYGTLDGDFDFSEYKDKELYFYVTPKDKYGNRIDINEPAKIIKALEDDSNKLTISLQKIQEGDHIYRVGVQIKKAGVYSLYSYYLDVPITFYVVNIIPSIVKSKCSIVDYHDETYDRNNTITYACEFKDENGNEIDIVEAQKIKDIEIKTTLYRNEKFLKTIDGKCSGSTCTYTYLTSYNGKYKFGTKLNGEEIVQTEPNVFYVVPEATSLEGCFFYNFDIDKWISINDIGNTIFNYYENDKDSDNIFLVDLVDLNDEQKTKYSDIEYGYNKFDPNKIKGKIKEEHSGYEGDLSFEKVIFRDKVYILGKLLNSKQEMRRSSLEYTLVLEFGLTQNLRYNYFLEDLGDYVACRKDLDLNNSVINNLNQDSIKAGESVKAAELVLRTDGEHLYNYFIDNVKNISYTDLNNNCFENKACSVEVVESKIAGIYDLLFKSHKEGDFKVVVQIDGNDLKDKYNLFTVNVKPNPQAYYLVELEPEAENYTVGEEAKFGFIIKDKYNNTINDVITYQSDYFGLQYTISVNGEKQTVSKYLIEKGDDCNDCYYVKENLKKSGNYSLTLQTKYSSSQIIFKYYKGPGKADHEKSIVKATNNNKININEKSTVEVYLYDEYDNYINLDEDAFKREVLNILIYAKNNEKTVYYTNFKDNIFTSDNINKKGKYEIDAYIYGKPIDKCLSCYFEVFDYGYDFYASQLKMIGETTTLMKKDSFYTLYEGLQRPAFEFDLMTQEGVPATDLEDGTVINATIVENDSEEEEEELFEAFWIDINKVLFILPENYELKKDKIYRIRVDNKNAFSYYYLSIVTYGDDKSKGNYDIDNTFVSPNVLYLKAGVSDSFIVELRDTKNLRYNQPLQLDQLKIVKNANLEVKPKLGNKNGQIIVEVKSEKACDYSELCTINMTYGNETIDTGVQVVVASGELDHFKVDKACIYDEGKSILSPGKAGVATKVYLEPYDKYENLIRDSIFDTNVYPEESISNLFNLKHENQYKTSIKSSTNPVSYRVELSLLSEKAGNLMLSSIYLDKQYRMEIKPGSPSKYSTGYLVEEPGNTPAGTNRSFVIVPKDENGNKIIMTNEEEIENLINSYSIKVKDSDGNPIDSNITINYNQETGEIVYTIDNTKSGEKVIDAYYGTEKIIVNNNIIYVVSGKPVLDKSLLVYNDKYYDLSDSFILSLAYLPLIDLRLYDEYGNPVDASSIEGIDFKLLKGDNQLSEMIQYNKGLRLYIDNSKADDYFKIKRTDNDYKLNIKVDNVEQNLTVMFSDEAPSKNTEKPVTFIINVDDLVLSAGGKGLISLTFYTEKGKPMGYFFNSVSDISVLCPDWNVTSKIIPGKSYGTYNILISSEEATNEDVSLYIEALNKSQEVKLKVVPSEINTCKFDNLNNATAGKSFSLSFECVDKFGNLVNLDEGKLSVLIKDPNGEIVDYSLGPKDEKSYNLYFKPSKSGQYKIKSVYLDQDFSFYTEAGDISPENCYLEVQDNADAGEEINVTIHVFDNCGNEVNLKDKDKLYFDLYYRNKDNSKYQKVETDPKTDKNIITYRQKVTKDGVNEFRGIEPKSSTILRCENCEIKVNPSEFDLENTDVYKFNSFSKKYSKLEKKDVLYNLDEDLFIRIYPKDKYGNKKSAGQLSNLTVSINGNELELDLNNPNDEYLEFYLKNEEFSKLNGNVQLVIKNGEKSVTYNVYVSGKDGFDEELDPSNTQLLESNLEFTVNKYGYFNFELRNVNNVRYNRPFTGTLKINSNDPEFKYEVYNKQSPIILVLVTSLNSNTFPNVGESRFEVSINSNVVLNPELFVNPDKLSSAEINEKETNLTVKAGENLKFSLVGYDDYNNRVVINPNEVKLNLNGASCESTFLDLSNGEQYYVFNLVTVGMFKIASELKNLFKCDYTVNVKPGEISPKKTLVTVKANPILAGSTVEILVNPKDKYDNDVDLDQVDLNKFYAYLLFNKYDIIIPKREVVSKSVFEYKKQLNKIGDYQFSIYYNGKKIKSDSVVVSTSLCKPENTLIYVKDKYGEYVKIDENTYVYSSYDFPLSLHLVFRDEHLNIISSLRGIDVFDAYLYGNNMKQLNWAYKSGNLTLNLDDDDNKDILEHLVTRSGKDAYDFTFTVKNSNDNRKTFNLKVNHFGKKEDEKDYGNGDYVLDKCKLSTNEAEFRAGTTFEVLLTLRTEEDLIYNGEFDTKNLDCKGIRPTGADKTFTCEVNFKSTGIYSLKYFTTLPKTREDNIRNVIKLYDSNHQERTFEVLLINKNGIPSKENTIITKELPSKIKEGEPQTIEFILQDDFGNVFESDDILDNLFFENNNATTEGSFVFNDVTKRYTGTLLSLSYPPKEVNIQLFFSIDKEKGEKVELFKDIQKSEFKMNADYDNSLVTSTNANNMNAGQFLDLNVYIRDSHYVCFDDDVSSELYTIVQGPLEETLDKRTYNFKKYEKETADELKCKIYYKLDINETNNYVKTGTYSIVVYAGKESKQLALYTQTVNSGPIDKNKFKIYYINFDEQSYTDQNIPAGNTIYFMVQAYDEFNNKIDNEILSKELFKIEIDSKSEDYTLEINNEGSGALSCSFMATKEADYKFIYSYEDCELEYIDNTGPNTIHYVSNVCNEKYPKITYPSQKDIDVSVPYLLIIQCFDEYNNTVKKGGATFSSDITLRVPDSENEISLDYKIIDNDDGLYNMSFVPPLLGEYSVNIYLEGNKYHEFKFNLTGRSCDKGYICPNNGDCVDDLRECIPDEIRCQTEENITKPFRCKGTDECVDSMTKCVPEGAGSCKYMNALYPLGKHALCSYYLPLDCKRKYPNYKILCNDGICRKAKTLQPNQRVCPIGKVLCLDLTCKDKLEDCYNDWEECSDTQVRCPDQSCVDDQKYCPTTITCSDPNQVVCPDGTCVDNEIYCAKLKTCPEETPYLCTENSCAVDAKSCPHSVACGHGKSLCSDLICRETC